MPLADLSLYWMGKFVLEERKRMRRNTRRCLRTLSCAVLNGFFDKNGVHNINPLPTTNIAVFGNFRTTLDAEWKVCNNKLKVQLSVH